MQSLFTPLQLGSLALPNRVVMAPMTRSRAIRNNPNALMATYYSQRATAGLIITEGIAPSPDALGYPRIPGLFNEEQVSGFRQVVDQVHAGGGRIVAQLMHVGRVAHPFNLPAGARIVAPSSVRAQSMMYTDAAGPQEIPTPEPMNESDIKRAQQAFAASAKNAKQAGFDGIELHGANGYLLEQFLSPHTNRRDDRYGGSWANRNRFLLEVFDEAARHFSADRIGVRLSPFSTYNDMRVFDDTLKQYTELAAQLGQKGAMYLHLVCPNHPQASEVEEQVRGAFRGPLILNGGFDAERANAAIEAGRSQLISFGRPFIANPDLVERLQKGTSLATADTDHFYSPGPEGYIDYAKAV